MSWCIHGYSPAYSRVFPCSVDGVVVGLLVSLRVLAYPVAFWCILAESFGILRKFVGLYGSQPHPRNRASRFYVLIGWPVQHFRGVHRNKGDVFPKGSLGRPLGCLGRLLGGFWGPLGGLLGPLRVLLRCLGDHWGVS